MDDLLAAWDAPNSEPRDWVSDLVSISEAAAYLRLSPQSIDGWIRAGHIRAYRVGPKTIRLRRSDVEALIVPIEVSA